MQLIFGDRRLDFGNLPHLMPQGLGVSSAQRFAAPTAFGRLAGDHFDTAIDRYQKAFVLDVSRLTANFPLGILNRLLRRPGMRMLGRRRLRRIARISRQLLFQLGNLGQKQMNDRLNSGGLPIQLRLIRNL